MKKQIIIISDENAPVEDLFNGDYEACEIKGKENTYAIIKKEPAEDKNN